MKRLIIQLTIWLLNKAYNTKNPKINELIRAKYREIASDEFEVHTEVVNVKKGKRKYQLIFIETPTGKHRINVGRFDEPRTLKVAS